MAALNRAETDKLRDAVTAIEYVITHGFNPADLEMKDPQAIYTERILKQVRSGVGSVIDMKGYFPS